MSFSVLLGKMLIFVVLMVIGYLCVHTGYISKAFVADASKLTINVFLVASILNSVFDSGMQLGLGGLAKIIGIMSLMYALSLLPRRSLQSFRRRESLCLKWSRR